MDVTSYLVFLFLPAFIFITAMCLYKKMKESTELEERLRNSGYPNPPAFESPLPIHPSPVTVAPDYYLALQMRRETRISLEGNPTNNIPYHIYNEMCHPTGPAMFSPFEPPPYYPGLAKS
ncbi:unnamed protein product [Auanema sp. JU1783]|nr:unnamed protein product [Auanema sp. JU1783]